MDNKKTIISFTDGVNGILGLVMYNFLLDILGRFSSIIYQFRKINGFFYLEIINKFGTSATTIITGIIIVFILAFVIGILIGNLVRKLRQTKSSKKKKK